MIGLAHILSRVAYVAGALLVRLPRHAKLEAAMPVPCTLCANPRRAEADAAIHGGTSFRAVAREFGGTKDVVGRHASKCLGVNRATPNAAAAARKRSQRRISRRIEDAALPPIENANDVVGDLQRLRVEAFDLFEGAKARGDWKQAQMLFNQLVAIVDRFGEMHRVLGAKGGGANVTIDARSINVQGATPEFMREYIAAVRAGDPVPAFPTNDAPVIDGEVTAA
jgi:hypothetical protein